MNVTTFDIRLPSVEDIPLTFCWVEPTTFMMGMPKEEMAPYNNEDGPPFEVTFSLGFWIGKHPVTQAQWYAIRGEIPSVHQSQGSDTPVENVSWDMAAEFGRQLNREYSHLMPDTYRARLPTEAEWEYCCTTRALFRYGIGNTAFDLDQAAWHKGNASTKMPVGQKLPNALGVHDMLGNVMEWCLDTAYYYPTSPQIDYLAHRESDLRVLRGGAYGTTPSDVALYCNGRGSAPASTRRGHIGLRLVLSALHIDT